MKTEITGVVLAGGKSTRMGEDKSTMLFQNQQLIQYSINVLEPFCKEILISSNNNKHHHFNHKIIPDEYTDIGPIAGLYSALKNITTNYLFILPCDSPKVTSQFIQYLISEIDNRYDILVPQYNHFLEPLFAIYHKRTLTLIEQQIKEKDYKLKHLLQQANTKIVDVEDSNCFVNINTKKDYNNCL